MYQQNNGAGAKWFFILAMVILAIVFALGFNIQDAKWLNGKIADATANQMMVTTDIDRQKANLDLQILQQRTEIQIEQEKQQAELQAAQRLQELQAQTTAANQFSEFRQDFYNTLNTSLLAFMIVACASLMAWVISKSLISYKLATVAVRQTPILVPVAQPTSRKPSAIAQKAREEERQHRQKQQNQQKQQKQLDQIEFPNTYKSWPDDGKSEELRKWFHPLITIAPSSAIAEHAQRVFISLAPYFANVAVSVSFFMALLFYARCGWANLI